MWKIGSHYGFLFLFIIGNLINFTTGDKPSKPTKNVEITAEQEKLRDSEGFAAIKELHRLMDDDQSGSIDRCESANFLTEVLKIGGSDRSQCEKAFHHDNDAITVDDLWKMWFENSEREWDEKQLVDWLTNVVKLPQYVNNFVTSNVTGITLPRMALQNSSYISNVLGIKNFVHRQKIQLKALDLVLFGFHDSNSRLKEYALALLLVILVSVLILFKMHRNKAQLRMEELSSMLSELKSMENDFVSAEKRFEERHSSRELKSVFNSDVTIELKSWQEKYCFLETEKNSQLIKIQVLEEKFKFKEQEYDDIHRKFNEQNMALAEKDKLIQQLQEQIEQLQREKQELLQQTNDLENNISMYSQKIEINTILQIFTTFSFTSTVRREELIQQIQVWRKLEEDSPLKETLGKDLFASLVSLSNEVPESSIENRKSSSDSGLESNKSRSCGSTESSNTSSFEEPNIVANENLIQLYPRINFKKEAFPLYLNIRDGSNILSLSAQHLRVHYNGKKDEPAMVRAICPISKTCGIFYFETFIVSSGTNELTVIGLCDKNVTLNNLPGWKANSFGYHGDDGKIFFNGQKSNSIETYTTGDVVGCGFNFYKKNIFFTKNGKRLGFDINFQSLVDLYPAIGMGSVGSILETNFGMNQFKYDLLKEFESSIPSFFVGTTFKRKDGTSIRAEKVLFNKVVGLYFSGKWCPPSLQFTPILHNFYNTLAHGNDFEIVFVSWDQSDSELKNYLSIAHGNWLYLPFGSPKIQELNAIYQVNSIPTLIIIHPNGNIIARNGRELVQSNQPKQMLDMWKASLY